MSFQATAWAARVKAGGPAPKAVLMMIANYMAPHDEEAEGFLSGFPGQDIIAEESEMSLRACRDHIAALVRRGLLQRKKRYKWDGTRTSDWYRIPVKSDGSVHEFPAVDDAGSLKEWPPSELPADSRNEGSDELPADSAGSRLPADSRSDYRQLSAGNKREDQLGIKDSFTHFVRKESSSFPTLSTETTDRAREAPRQEKISSTEEQKQQTEADRQAAIDELTQQVRDFVMGLKYYGREYGTARGVTREQLHTLADLVTPFAEAGVDMRRLRSALVDRTEKGVHDIVALYMSRLKKIHTADVMPIRRPEIHTEPTESVAEVSQLPTPRSGDHDELPARRKLLEETPVPPKPPWCGQCEKYTRQTPKGHRCPTCSLAAVITSTPLELVPDEHEPSPEEMRALFMAALAS